MSGVGSLALRVAEALKDRCTHQLMQSVGLEAGLVIPAEADGLSKRDRALAALEGKNLRELGDVARRLGAHWSDYSLEEAGFAVLETEEPPISEITRRDIAKCFGDDLSGEQNVLELVRRFFPVDTLGADFFAGRSLASDIKRHMILNSATGASNIFSKRLTHSHARVIDFRA
jgi:hypothetical protein